jgi:hypothetical protein
MSSKGQSFLTALHALCLEHQVMLYVGGDYDYEHLIVADLEAGDIPLRIDEVEDDTTSTSPLTLKERGA